MNLLTDLFQNIYTGDEIDHDALTSALKFLQK